MKNVEDNNVIHYFGYYNHYDIQGRRIKIAEDTTKLEESILDDMKNNNSMCYNYFICFISDNIKDIDKIYIRNILDKGFEFQEDKNEITSCMDGRVYITKKVIYVSDELMGIINEKIDKKYMQLHGYYIQ